MTRRTGFRAMGDIIRNSAFIVPIYGAIVLMLGVATVRSWLDFTTSLAGAESLFFARGTVNYELNVFSLAAMPQLITIVFSYVALATPFNSELKWLKLAAIAALVASLALDIYTGFLYYNTISHYPWAMSGLADTAFSEIGFTVAFGLTLDLFPDVRKRFAQWNSKHHVVSVGGGRKQQLKSRGKKQGPMPMTPPVRANQISQPGPLPPRFSE